jgi:S1-C subfamily serine protease
MTFLVSELKSKLAVLAVGLLLASCAATNDGSLDIESRDITLNESAEPTSAAGNDELRPVISSISPTYVGLRVIKVDSSEPNVDKARGGAITAGSGYIVDQSGIVMTAAHVSVEKGNDIDARAANGRIYSGKVIAINKTNDMAIIKLRGFSGKAVSPVSPGCVNKGAKVFTLGKPQAQGDLARIGSLQDRHFGRAVRYGKFGYPDALVLHMGTQKGESGGPVFDANGKLIGMVVSTLSDAAGNSINLAHAIPSTALAQFLCSNTQCSSAWASLATRNVDECS